MPTRRTAKRTVLHSPKGGSLSNKKDCTTETNRNSAQSHTCRTPKNSNGMTASPYTNARVAKGMDGERQQPRGTQVQGPHKNLLEWTDPGPDCLSHSLAISTSILLTENEASKAKSEKEVTEAFSFFFFNENRVPTQGNCFILLWAILIIKVPKAGTALENLIDS